MTEPRLYVEAPLEAGAELGLDRARLHYLGRVLRRRAGERVLVFNGRDGEWRAVLEPAGRNAARLRVAEPVRPQMAEPGPVLYLAPPKRPRLEWLLEKAVELGVARIVPVLTERTVVKLANRERLRTQMVEAAEQCRRLTLPLLDEPLPLWDALAARPPGSPLLMADEAGGGVPLLDALRRAPAADFLVGPEGGFAPAEATLLRAKPDTLPVSLGPLILRTETAAILLLACWRAARAASG
jgi:16S rRNA (uracil1498-N3)-methyltransferase